MEFSTFEEFDAVWEPIFERMDRRINQLRPYWDTARISNTTTDWIELGREIILLEESVGCEIQEAVYDEFWPCLQADQLSRKSYDSPDLFDPPLSEQIEWSAGREYRNAVIRRAKSSYIISVAYSLESGGVI